MSIASSTASLARAPAEPPSGGAIQPLGFVAVVSREWLVDSISANIGDYCGAEAKSIVGRPLIDMLGADAVHALRNQVALLRAPDAVARLFACPIGETGNRFDFTLRIDRTRTVIEGQTAGAIQHGDTIATVRALIGRLDEQEALTPMLDVAVRQIRALTGFDRVAIYRGRDDGPAALLAQTARSLAAVVSTLDEQAYASLRTAPAMVADCDADAVPMTPAWRLNGALLRAPSVADRNRMRDAGAKARLQLPLSLAGEPWGLAVCDHTQPRAPSAELHSAIGLFTQMLGLLIEIRLLKQV